MASADDHKPVCILQGYAGQSGYLLKKSENRFAKKVHKAVDVVKLDREGRHRYMTVEMWIREEAEIAKIEGRAQGIA